MEEKMLRIFENIFDETDIDNSTSPDTLEKWDSVAHLKLVEEIENEFNVRFRIDEIIEMINLLAIKEILREHGVE